jgi:AcrR family transcriptional regulator
MPSMPTQAERTAATRGRLLDAALDVLAEQGYAATTTVEVAKRAGVSRGAQLHHFPTKAELLAAAVEHLYARRRAEYRAAVAAMPDGVDRIDSSVDLLWSMFSGPTWLELQVAARTDPELRALVDELHAPAFEEELAIFHEVMPLPDPELERQALTFTFTVMDGLALQQLCAGNHADVALVLETLKGLARLALALPEGVLP